MDTVMYNCIYKYSPLFTLSTPVLEMLEYSGINHILPPLGDDLGTMSDIPHGLLIWLKVESINAADDRQPARNPDALLLPTLNS